MQFTTMLKNKDEEISQTVKELHEGAKASTNWVASSTKVSMT